MKEPEPGHILNEAWNEKNRQNCPNCGADFTHWRVVDYDPIWRDGRVVCECGQFIRSYDAG